jgi:hypothetical protein
MGAIDFEKYDIDWSRTTSASAPAHTQATRNDAVRLAIAAFDGDVGATRNLIINIEKLRADMPLAAYLDFMRCLASLARVHGPRSSTYFARLRASLCDMIESAALVHITSYIKHKIPIRDALTSLSRILDQEGWNQIIQVSMKMCGRMSPDSGEPEVLYESSVGNSVASASSRSASIEWFPGVCEIMNIAAQAGYSTFMPLSTIGKSQHREPMNLTEFKATVARDLAHH